MTSWYIEDGPQSDVVISSRVRLARNLEGYPFPSRMNDAQREEVIKAVGAAVLSDKRFGGFTLAYMDKMEPVEKHALVEKHLISRELAANESKSAVITSGDETVSIMVNEEDHLRLQALSSGMQADKAWELCSSVDDMIDTAKRFAFSMNYGYLTSCPTNLGTGLRVSFMMHLPALIMTGHIRRVLEACSKLGITLRGLYGENSEASGNILQISNQVTMGLSEEEIIANLNNIATQIISQERALRNKLHREQKLKFEDRIFRSLAVFSSARIMSSDESLKLLSDLRLGKDMGIIKNIKTETLNEIMLMIQPANMQKAAGRSLTDDERDEKRAEYIRGRLGYIW